MLLFVFDRLRKIVHPISPTGLFGLLAGLVLLLYYEAHFHTAQTPPNICDLASVLPVVKSFIIRCFSPIIFVVK